VIINEEFLELFFKFLAEIVDVPNTCVAVQKSLLANVQPVNAYIAGCLRIEPSEYTPTLSNPKLRPKAPLAEATGSSEACCARVVLNGETTRARAHAALVAVARRPRAVSFACTNLPEERGS
jgi:hypothetical protein